jgi:hypothetical protein
MPIGMEVPIDNGKTAGENSCFMLTMKNKCVIIGSTSRATIRATNHEHRRVNVAFLTKTEVSRVAE